MPNKGVNTQIIEAKSQIFSVLNEIKLPIAITQMIVAEILGLINKEVENVLAKEKEEESQDENK